jgi:hypothetical protein
MAGPIGCGSPRLLVSVISVTSYEVQCEHELAWGERVIPIRGGGELATAPAEAPLPDTLVRVLALLERFDLRDDLAKSCTLEVSRELVTRLTSRTLWLTTAGRLPHTEVPLAHLTPTEQVQRIATVVASQLTYDWRLVKPGLLDRVRRIATAVSEYLGDPIDEARHFLTEPSPGVCRHYSSVMSTLFFALRQTSDRPANAYLAKIGGDALAPELLAKSDDGHMWNLMVDLERGALFGIDVTWADQVHEHYDQPFELWFANTEQHRHASGLLGWLGVAWGMPSSPLFEHAEVEAVYAQMVDPSSPRGMMLLFHLAEGSFLCEASRARIIAHLEREPFEVLVPDWRPRLARYRGNDLIAGDHWNTLLDRVGLESTP